MPVFFKLPLGVRIRLHRQGDIDYPALHEHPDAWNTADRRFTNIYDLTDQQLHGGLFRAIETNHMLLSDRFDEELKAFNETRHAIGVQLKRREKAAHYHRVLLGEKQDRGRHRKLQVARNMEDEESKSAEEREREEQREKEKGQEQAASCEMKRREVVLESDSRMKLERGRGMTRRIEERVKGEFGQTATADMLAAAGTKQIELDGAGARQEATAEPKRIRVQQCSTWLG